MYNAKWMAQERKLSILHGEVKKCFTDKAILKLKLEKWVGSCFAELWWWLDEIILNHQCHKLQCKYMKQIAQCSA
jgi:hypothetical protein